MSNDLFRTRRDSDRRRTRQEVPWLSAVKLSWVLEVNMLNISASGMLVDRTTKLTPGTATEFELAASNNTLVIPARFVRTEVATVDRLGVKYHTAVMFMKELAFPDIQDAPALSVTGALTDLLAYALGDLEISGSSAALRGRFAERLGELIAASDVKIIGTPVLASPVADSVCLTVPASDGSRQFLQVVFDAERELGATDFALLQADASLAAV